MSSHPTSPHEGFDPQKPFVAEDGLEYEDLADYLIQKPVDCRRNATVREFIRYGASSEDPAVIWKLYHGYNRAGTGPANDFPQLIERFAPAA